MFKYAPTRIHDLLLHSLCGFDLNFESYVIIYKHEI